MRAGRVRHDRGGANSNCESHIAIRCRMRAGSPELEGDRRPGSCAAELEAPLKPMPVIVGGVIGMPVLAGFHGEQVNRAPLD